VSRGRAPVDWRLVWAVMARDLTAVRRSKSVLLPMILVPFFLLVLVPVGVGLAARSTQSVDIGRILHGLPHQLTAPVTAHPPREQLLVLVLGFLLAPLFLIVPLMVSAVLAADTFAGEKERRTMETLLHLPIRDRDLFVAKLLSAFLPALAISWLGFGAYALSANAVAWPVMHRVFLPTRLWAVVILWVAPAVAAFGLGVMVRVSVRAETAQAANQLGGAVVLPLIFLAMGQATGILLVELPVALAVGAVLWAAALWLCGRGAARFRRDQLAARL